MKPEIGITDKNRAAVAAISDRLHLLKDHEARIRSLRSFLEGR